MTEEELEHEIAESRVLLNEWTRLRNPAFPLVFELSSNRVFVRPAFEHVRFQPILLDSRTDLTLRWLTRPLREISFHLTV